MARRYFAHGELPLVLVALLDQRPRHGYEVMAELKRLFAPAYRPSPGSVYPALEGLAAEGLIDGDDVGDRTVWRVTEDGRQALDARRATLSALELRTGVRLAEDGSLEPLLARFTARVMRSSGRVDPEVVSVIVDRAATQIEGLSERTDHRRGAR